MEPTWHYRQGDEEGGPVSRDELRRLAESGRLKASSFVRSDDDPAWQPAGLCTEFREAFITSPPPPLPPALPLPAQVKPIWPWVAGAVVMLGIPAAIVLLIALLGNTERSPAEESIPSEVVAGGSPTAEERSASPPLTISGEDATEDLIQMMAEMTEEQQTAIGLQYLATRQDFYGARIRITNRGDVPIRVRPENVRLHLQGDTVGVSSSRDSRFLRTTLLEPGRYVEGLVVYRAHREAGAAMRLGSGRISYLLE
jgi:hypothetical protein